MPTPSTITSTRPATSSRSDAGPTAGGTSTRPSPRTPRGPSTELAPAFWQQTLQQEDTQQRLAANVFRGISLVDHALDEERGALVLRQGGPVYGRIAVLVSDAFTFEVSETKEGVRLDFRRRTLLERGASLPQGACSVVITRASRSICRRWRLSGRWLTPARCQRAGDRPRAWSASFAPWGRVRVSTS